MNPVTRQHRELVARIAMSVLEYPEARWPESVKRWVETGESEPGAKNTFDAYAQLLASREALAVAASKEPPVSSPDASPSNSVVSKKTLELTVPERLLCQADVDDALTEFRTKLSYYLQTHCPEQWFNQRNSGYKIVPQAWVMEVNNHHMSQLKELFPKEDLERVIPMQMLLNEYGYRLQELRQMKEHYDERLTRQGEQVWSAAFASAASYGKDAETSKSHADKVLEDFRRMTPRAVDASVRQGEG